MLPFQSIKIVFTGIQTVVFGCGNFNICKCNFKINPKFILTVNEQGIPAKYLTSSL